MSRRDELDLVVQLACLTEDRAPDEQRALLATALRLDCDFGAFTSRNQESPNCRPPFLVDLVLGTVDAYCDGGGDKVRLTSVQRLRLERLADNWKACERCGQPNGVHGPKPELACPR